MATCVEPKTILARWESLRGKYWLELYRDEYGLSYRSDNGGGYLGDVTENVAFQRAYIELGCWPSRHHRVK